MQDKMSFLYATDKNFVHVMLVSLYTLLERNSDDDLEVYVVISTDVDEEERRKILEVGKAYKKEVYLIEKPDFDSLTHVKLDIKRYSASMFSRIAVGTILPPEVNRVVYLDCDTYILDSLRSLWEQDLHGKIIGAVNDSRSIGYSYNLGIRNNNCYINSGVLLIDLRKYRRDDIERVIFKTLAKLNGLLEFPDNDAICKVLQDEIELLPLRYNVTSVCRMCTYKEILALRHPAHIIDREEYDKANQNPAILHFTTFFMMKGRPWMLNCNHPDTAAYQKLRKKLGEEPEENSLSHGWKQRVYSIVEKTMPRKLVIYMFGVIHAYIKPLIQSRRMALCRRDYTVEDIKNESSDKTTAS